MINTSITPLQIAWIAGIYEGEGCLGLSKGGRWTVVVTMTDPDIIDRLKLYTGMGTVQTLKPGRPERKVPHRWVVASHQEVTSLLWMIRPHLGLRRAARADECLNWMVNGCPSLSTDEHKAREAARMQRARGWREPTPQIV